MTNVATKGALYSGDILLGVGKLDKAIKIRLGTGGNLIATSSMSLTSYVLPGQAVVYDAFLNVLTPSTGATKTLLVGTSGTPAGFLSAIAVGTSGIVLPVVAAGTSGVGTYGTFMVTQTTGNAPVQKTYASDSTASRTLTFTPASTDWIAFAADLYLYVTDLTQ